MPSQPRRRHKGDISTRAAQQFQYSSQIFAFLLSYCLSVFWFVKDIHTAVNTLFCSVIIKSVHILTSCVFRSLFWTPAVLPVYAVFSVYRDVMGISILFVKAPWPLRLVQERCGEQCFLAWLPVEVSAVSQLRVTHMFTESSLITSVPKPPYLQLQTLFGG